MVGLLQIIIWMGCVYLILKGISVLQTGLASGNEKKGELLALGYAAVIIAIGAAVVFFGLAETQVASLQEIRSPY